ncbi:MAG: hypothetical protein RMK20_09820 [Verrucomicrobiales bacterium]|nr:hypothetical protein [Verrucomicrobiales bacterium]
MKRIWLTGGLLAALPGVLWGAQVTYENNSIIVCPPQTPPVIDATNFINRNWFEINVGTEPYETSSTVNYTNEGTMIGQIGFRFETAPSGGGARRRAGTVSNSGRIDAGNKLLANATNFLHRGVINMGYFSLLSVAGRNIDFNRGTVTSTNTGFVIVGTGTNFVQVSGIMDGYWNASVSDGSNTAHLRPATLNNLPSITPFHLVTNRNNQTLSTILSPDNQVFYANIVDVDASNRVTQAVFLGNTNPAFNVSVYFPSLGGSNAGIWVEWRWVITNQLGQRVTNWIYLRDTFGVETNLQVEVNGTAGGFFRPTYKPVNYTFYQTGPFSLGTPATPGSPLGVFDTSRPVVTNEFTAYRARFEATTELIEDVVGRNVTNLSGRVELRAENTLNLSNAQISASSYALLQVTNHFMGSHRARIVSPWLDIHLRRTNGNLYITNLVAPVVPKPEGIVDLWSARWPNDVAGVTNQYHVLFVNSELAPTLPPRIQSLSLRCTNTAGGGGEILISDVLNVTSNLLIETEKLTITSNAPGSPTVRGEINLLSGQTYWPTGTPRLRYLTNNGALTSLNAVFFGGSRSQPYYTTNFNEPYVAMVNRGEILNYGSHIWADYFENRGLILPYFGAIVVQSTNALFENGVFQADNGDVSISSGRLIITNHPIAAGWVLSLAATNFLDDGTLANAAAALTNITTIFTDPTSAILNTSVAMISNKNYWIAGDGVSLLARPPQGSLLGTTIEARAQPGRQVFIRWAGADLGCNPAGFSNNVALGRLILDGGENSLFTFTGIGLSNALYVDRLEFRDYDTNTIVNAFNEIETVEIDPNMRVYYADAVESNGVSVAVRINGANGGRFCWVQDFAGFFSSTNLIAPDGETNTLNVAMVTSPDHDRDSDTVENRNDSTPLLRPQDVALKAHLETGPSGPRVRISWRTTVNAANHVYYRDSLSGPWLPLTNFISSGLMPQPGGVRVSITEPVRTTGARYYRVRVDAP